jgi:MFS family permease
MSIAVTEFGYDKNFQGIVLSGFYYGYLLTQIPAGALVSKFPAKWVLLSGVVVWAFVDLSTVWVSQLPLALIFMRVMMGIGQGVNNPCVHHLASKWFPEDKKSFLITLVTSGQDFGAILSICVAPVIAGNLGWNYIFIIFAILDACWMITFGIFARNSPSNEHKSVDSSESIPLVIRKTPWKKIFSNRACIAIFFSHICADYPWYILLNWIPTYFKEKLGYDLRSESIIAALPYISGMIGGNIAGKLSDILITKYSMPTVKVRKLFNCLGLFGSAIGLIFSQRLCKTESWGSLCSVSLCFSPECQLLDIGSI